MRTRDEHLQWCKDRALEYWRAGDLVSAVVSMASDMNKHEHTKFNPSNVLIMLGAGYARDCDSEAVKRWIEGFR